MKVRAPQRPERRAALLSLGLLQVMRCALVPMPMSSPRNQHEQRGKATSTGAQQ